MLQIFKNNLFAVLLVLIAGFICLANWVPGTYLSGWDTIHPEFNFTDYFKRVLSTWQEHQGLGAAPSQAHAAELPRLVIYFIFSLFLPVSLLRYSYFFLTLILGPLGVFFFLKNYLKSNFLLPYTQNAAAFLGGLLYLLNLTVLQHFQVPLEMFATHYATLGWIFLFSTNYLLKQQKKDLICFSTSVIFASPMAHTPTLFYISLGIFAVYLLNFSLLSRSLIALKRAAFLIVLVIILNLYWILPNIYYIKNYGNAVVSSKIHSQFSDRAFLVSVNFANIRDTAILKNFIFEWGKYDDTKGVFIHLLNNWQPHLRNTRINLIGLFIFLIIFLGFINSIKKKHLIGFSIVPVFIIPFFFIANDNPIFHLFINFIEKNLALLKEALRFPYTKFSILLLFSYCFYFAFMIAVIIGYLKKFVVIWFLKDFKKAINPIKVEYLIANMCLILITVSLVIFMWPFFKGHLINSKMRVQIPNAYFDLFDWFKEKDSTARIAQFPVHTFWGWSYYNFEYEGAGFLWFGLNQPLLNREFDRWMPYNENYYWEISNAVYSRDLALLEKVLEKYQVSFLLIDSYAVDASSAKSPYLGEFEELISHSLRITLAQTFGRIKVYEFENNFFGSKFVNVFNNLPIISPKYIWSDLDKGYQNFGNYLAVSDQDIDFQAQVYYPFRSLFSNRSQQEHEYNVLETENYFIFKKDIPNNIRNFNLNVSDINQQSLVWYDKDKLDQSGFYIPTLNYANGILSIKVPKIKGYFSAAINAALEIDKLKIKNCDYLSAYKKGRKREDFSLDIVRVGSADFLRINSLMGNNCSADFLLPNLPNRFGYLISVESRNIKNKSLLFWLENTNTRRSNLETYLPKGAQISKSYFIQPPMEEYGQGYFLHFDNWSFNQYPSINDLGRINIYPIPYKYLVNISLNGFQTKPIPSQHSDSIIDIKRLLSTFYLVNLKSDLINVLDKPVFYLSQSFDSGWVAFSIDGFKIQKLNKHLLINNWANGWDLSGNKFSNKVIIFFWPQFLQLFGYITLLVTIVIVLKRKAWIY